MTSIITLTYNGTTYRVFCNQAAIGGKKNTDSKPYANIGGPVEVQTLAYENLTIALQGVKLINTTSTTYPNPLTWSVLMSMYKHAYSGPSGTGVNGPITLTITTATTDTNGKFLGTGTNVTGLAGTSPIPVVIESFNFPFDASDSREGYLPTGSITFRETL